MVNWEYARNPIHVRTISTEFFSLLLQNDEITKKKNYYKFHWMLAFRSTIILFHSIWITIESIEKQNKCSSSNCEIVLHCNKGKVFALNPLRFKWEAERWKKSNCKRRNFKFMHRVDYVRGTFCSSLCILFILFSFFISLLLWLLFFCRFGFLPPFVL